MSNDDWLHVDGSVRVELAGLNDFASYMGAEVDNVAATQADGINIFDGTVVPFGGAGLAEGNAFGQAHLNCLMSAMQFLFEMHWGLNNLGTGAQAIAMEYGSADAFSRATLDSVEAAFRPVEVDTGALSPEARAAVERAVNEAEDRQETVLDAGQSDRNFQLGDAAGGYPQVIGAGTPGEYAIGPDAQDVRANPSPPYGETAASPVGVEPNGALVDLAGGGGRDDGSPAEFDQQDVSTEEAAQDAINRRILEQELMRQYQDAIARGADHHG